MTDNSTPRPLCQATTKAGRPCQNTALPNSPYCHRHQPALSTQHSALSTDPPPADLHRQLAAELRDLAQRLQALAPTELPPPDAPAATRSLKDELLSIGPLPELRKQLRAAIGDESLDMDALKGLWYMAKYSLQYQAGVLKRRVKGDYETDEWGLDWEFLEAARPFFSFLYKLYWRVETTGMDHIPEYGRALLVANHGGQLPWDSLMLTTAVLSQHPAQRLVRCLYDEGYAAIPFAPAVLNKIGQVTHSVPNGTRLLEQDELVAVFPEGQRGAAKTYKERYKLARFGRGSFVKMALATGAPIIPVAVVGAEETHVSIAQSRTLARLTGLPYFPILPAGLLPLPAKWSIDFGQPIVLDEHGPDADDAADLVLELTHLLRRIVQDMVTNRLMQRKSVFMG